jgi:hypothetical protein
MDESISLEVRERARLNDERLGTILLQRKHDIVRFGDVRNPSRSKLYARLLAAAQ